MPTTLTGLLLFVVLLLPGITYTAIRERRTPERQRSLFRETVEVATVSIITDTAALVAFAIVKANTRPQATPDIARLIRERSTYVADAYGLIGAWLLGLITFAIVLATIAAFVMPKQPHISGVSAWWRLFQDRPAQIRKANRARWWTRLAAWLRRSEQPDDPTITIGCYLDDGSYVAGELHTHSRLAEDSPDRDIVLAAPIWAQRPGDIYKAEDVDAVCLSARHITMISVQYYSPSAAPPPPPSPAGADSGAAEAAGADAGSDEPNG